MLTTSIAGDSLVMGARPASAAETETGAAVCDDGKAGSHTGSKRKSPREGGLFVSLNLVLLNFFYSKFSIPGANN
jgi:hypothetical protein